MYGTSDWAERAMVIDFLNTISRSAGVVWEDKEMEVRPVQAFPFKHKPAIHTGYNAQRMPLNAGDGGRFDPAPTNLPVNL